MTLNHEVHEEHERTFSSYSHFVTFVSFVVHGNVLNTPNPNFKNAAVSHNAVAMSA
jgi:hypothetical protein